MALSLERKTRLVNAIIGLILIISGVLLIYYVFFRTSIDDVSLIFTRLSYLSPMLCIMGIVIFIRGIFWGAPAFSGRTVLYTGLLMLLLGVFPWAYTPLIIRDRGMEGSGMLGMLIFLFVGIPGLILTIIGFIIRD